MKRLAIDKLQSAFSWADQQGLVLTNLIDRKAKKALGIRRKGTRGREYVRKSGEHNAMLSIAKPYFADLLTFMEGTGCRPGEAYNCEAMHFDRELEAIVFRWNATEGYIHKTAQKTGRDRVIFLSPDLVALVERLRENHPTGYLFRNRDSKQWTNSAVYLMLKRLRKRLNLTSKMIAYSYRHTFATNWLKNGGSIKVLADLMGNSVAIIEHHYGHLDADRGMLRKLLCDFKASQKAKAGRSPLPASLIEKVISLVTGELKQTSDEDVENLRKLLVEFRLNAETEKTHTQGQAAPSHASS